jgi:hypothetical protein
MDALPETGSANGGDTNVALLRFIADARDDGIFLNQLIFKAQTGSLSAMTNYKVWADTDGDEQVDQVIGDAATPLLGNLTFTTASGWTGVTVASGSVMVLEVHGDVPDPLGGVRLQLALDTSKEAYAGAVNVTEPTAPLSGISTDGVCSETSCHILVTTSPSATVWTFVGCGDGVIQEATEECDAGGQPSEDCDSTCHLTIPIPEF